jgi:Rod binding domain-containing protein
MPTDPVLSSVLTTGLGFDSSVTAKDSPEKIRAAASQFESLLISQVLKASHEDEGEGEGWLGTGEDQTAGSVMGLAEDYFARAMSARGGFGLARTIASGLEHRVAESAASNSSPEPSPDPEQAPHTSD